MKALSIRSPWWWFILHGRKDIENRDWSTSFRGTVLIHASKWWRQFEVLDDTRAALDCVAPIRKPEVFSWLDVEQIRKAAGCIVGQVDVVDCVERSDSPWFFGKYGFVLENPVCFARPIPFKGALGFFDVPDDLVAEALR